MDKKAKVELTQAWWKANKAKTLKDGVKFGPALKRFETVSAGLAAARGLEAAWRCLASAKALDDLEAARLKLIKACGPLHAETKHVLENQYKAEIAAARKRVEKSRAKVDKELASVKFDVLKSDRTWRGLWVDYAMNARRLDEQVGWFLDVVVGGKRNKASYDRYVALDAPQALNIGTKLRGHLMQHYDLPAYQALATPESAMLRNCGTGVPPALSAKDAWDELHKEIQPLVEDGLSDLFPAWFWAKAKELAKAEFKKA